jgi:hypothetical protein
MDPTIDITFGGVVDRWNSAPESDPAWVLIEVQGEDFIVTNLRDLWSLALLSGDAILAGSIRFVPYAPIACPTIAATTNCNDLARTRSATFCILGRLGGEKSFLPSAQVWGIAVHPVFSCYEEIQKHLLVGNALDRL